MTCQAPRDHCLCSAPSAWTELPLCSCSPRVKSSPSSHLPRAAAPALSPRLYSQGGPKAELRAHSPQQCRHPSQGRAQSPCREGLAGSPPSGAAIPTSSPQVTAAHAEQCHTPAPGDLQLLLGTACWALLYGISALRQQLHRTPNESIS